MKMMKSERDLGGNILLLAVQSFVIGFREGLVNFFDPVFRSRTFFSNQKKQKGQLKEIN